MTMEQIKNLPAELRAVQSRSKGDLLERAAQAIEALQEERDAMLAALNDMGIDCDLCAHNGTMICNEVCDCEKCGQDCICRSCEDGKNFVLRKERTE